MRYIATVRDTVPQSYYNKVTFYRNSTNQKVLSYNWGDKYLVSYLSGRNFTYKEMDENIYEQYFANRNGDYFNIDEQVIIKDDTTYWVIY